MSNDRAQPASIWIRGLSRSVNGDMEMNAGGEVTSVHKHQFISKVRVYVHVSTLTTVLYTLIFSHVT
jgi:hypothetical protein